MTAPAPTWDGRTFTRWPVRPAPDCSVCGQPAQLYPAGPRCDGHRPGGPPPPTYPITRPHAGGYALEHAHTRWPGARACAAVDNRGRRTCPYPLDPANGDYAVHMACESGFGQALAEVHAHDVRRHTDAARAAVAAAKGAT